MILLYLCCSHKWKYSYIIFTNLKDPNHIKLECSTTVEEYPWFMKTKCVQQYTIVYNKYCKITTRLLWMSWDGLKDVSNAWQQISISVCKTTTILRKEHDCRDDAFSWLGNYTVRS